LGTNCFAQTFQLKIIGNSISENTTIDSLQYKATHANSNAILAEIKALLARLSKNGYLEVQQLEYKKINDTSYISKLSLGSKIKSIHIYMSKNLELIDKFSLVTKKDTLTLPYNETESFLDKSLKKLEQKGFGFAKLKLVNITKKNTSVHADLQIDLGQKRQIDEIVVKLSESSSKNSFPTGHLKQINRKYNKSTFNQDAVRKIQNDFKKFGFLNQIKTPEVLFTEDATKVYVYLEQKKSNTFDGFLGFVNNDNNKLIFNGYLDLNLENTIKAGEQFSLYWKSNGENQKTFKTCLDLPYIFKTPIGLKAEIAIFKQDSTFQNTKTNINLGYLLDYKTRIYLGYQTTESSDIQNTNNNLISDYSNSFLTTNLEYSHVDNVSNAFANKTTASIAIGIGARSTSSPVTTSDSNKQSYININGTYNIYLNPKNCININYQNYFLKSNSYIINELYRFGGTKSIRGFAENSLQASFFTAIVSEYRYIISPDLYVHSILDYAYYEDKTSTSKENIVGLGIGAGLRTKNGNLKFSLSNGLNQNQNINFQNSIVSVNYDIEF
jgi:hypothetical protein